MSTAKREAWGRLRKLPSGRWQVRYSGPDGETYTARTDDDKALTFLTKTDARTWLAAVHTKISLGQWNPPAAVAAQNRADAAAERARSMGFEEYSERWVQMIKTERNRSGKIRAIATVRCYQSKVSGYLIPEFGDTPVREIDVDRFRVMTQRLDRIPAPLNPKSKFNGITRPVLIVLMMILRQAARDGVIPAAPSVSIPRQESVRHDSDHDEGEDVVAPRQVEALYAAVPEQWAIMVPLAAWCQLRRGECLGLQRRDVEWHDDGSATLHVRRQLLADTARHVFADETGTLTILPSTLVSFTDALDYLFGEEFTRSDAENAVVLGFVELSRTNPAIAEVLTESYGRTRTTLAELAAAEYPRADAATCELVADGTLSAALGNVFMGDFNPDEVRTARVRRAVETLLAAL